MREFIKRFKQKRQFKKNMTTWIRLCKVKSGRRKIFGISKVGKLTHKISINGVGEISTRDPIYVSYE